MQLMVESWGRSVEQILLATAENNARVIGVLSPDGNSGVSTLCRQLADASKRAGARTLLVDFSQPVLPASGGGWGPTDGAAQVIKHRADSYDVLEARPTRETRALFNNGRSLDELFNNELKGYDKVIVDLPAVLGRQEDRVNPIAAARALEMIILVCVANRVTESQVKETVSLLEGAGVKLGGLVLNDLCSPTLGVRIAQSVENSAWMPGWLAARLKRKILNSDLLNSHL